MTRRRMFAAICGAPAVAAPPKPETVRVRQHATYECLACGWTMVSDPVVDRLHCGNHRCPQFGKIIEIDPEGFEVPVVDRLVRESPRVMHWFSSDSFAPPHWPGKVIPVP